MPIDAEIAVGDPLHVEHHEALAAALNLIEGVSFSVQHVYYNETWNRPASASVCIFYVYDGDPDPPNLGEMAGSSVVVALDRIIRLGLRS